MYSKYKDILPIELREALPTELNYIHLEGFILRAYTELLKGDVMGLFTYKYDDINRCMTATKTANYETTYKRLYKKFEQLKPCLTHDTTLILPRHPEEIARGIYKELSSYNHHYNSNLITVDIIKETMRAITGRENMPRSTEKEKFENWFLSWEVVEK